MPEVIERGDKDEATDLHKAQQIGETLMRHYPNHPWAISFQGRVMVIRHLAINDVVEREMGQQGFGFMLGPEKFDRASPQALAHSAVMAGGQMLEAFSLPRGPWDGRLPILPKGWQRKKQGGF